MRKAKKGKLAKAMLMGAHCTDCEKECFAPDSDSGIRIRRWTVEEADRELDIIVKLSEEPICKKFKRKAY